jgi:hypothetical protein
MEDEMQKMLVALLISALMTPTSGFAQTASANDGSDGTLRTSVIQVSMPALPAGFQPQQQQQTQERGWVGRHPVLFGALVGLGVGLGVEAAVIPGESGGEPHSAYLPMFGGVGAGIGALAGLIVSAARRQ